MKIKAVRNLSFHGRSIEELVKYAHEDDACIDLICCEDTTIPSLAWSTIPTGISIQFPASTFGLIRPRSGLAKKYGIGVLAGVIDQGYRGEIQATLINHSTLSHTFWAGDRIAQLAILPYFKVSLEWAKELGKTERGESGHGSTGK